MPEDDNFIHINKETAATFGILSFVFSAAACIVAAVALLTDDPKGPAHYAEALGNCAKVTDEIHCTDTGRFGKERYTLKIDFPGDTVTEELSQTVGPEKEPVLEHTENKISALPLAMRKDMEKIRLQFGL